MKDVTVIIPNYNGIKFVKDCLDSVRRQDYKDFETIIVDNASADGSYEYIKENYPEMELIRNEENYGFSVAVNMGIKASKTEYVLLLNNDTELEPNFITEIVKCIEQDDKIFACSSKMINFYNRDVMDDAGDMYSITASAYQRGCGLPAKGYNKQVDVFAACAGAALYRREIFEEIGYFDVQHFAYLEDIDVGFRAKLYGYRNVYCPKAVVYHMGSATSGSKYNTFKVKLAARNNIYLIYKNMPLWFFILNFPFLLAGFMIKTEYFYRKHKFGDDYVAGLKEGLTTCYKLKRVKFDSEMHKRCIGIEKDMIKGFVFYCFDVLRRKKQKMNS